MHVIDNDYDLSIDQQITSVIIIMLDIMKLLCTLMCFLFHLEIFQHLMRQYQ